mmetsp:Transcript_698/g.680  ORF Transcript_698/g.680 Transcript_698/m.680 type:complete len:198 (+) Transcript_698:202-795(+)
MDGIPPHLLDRSKRLKTSNEIESPNNNMLIRTVVTPISAPISTSPFPATTTTATPFIPSSFSRNFAPPPISINNNPTSNIQPNPITPSSITPSPILTNTNTNSNTINLSTTTTTIPSTTQICPSPISVSVPPLTSITLPPGSYPFNQLTQSQSQLLSSIIIVPPPPPPPTDFRLVYDDNTMCMEEKRAMLPRYRYNQ